MYQRSKVTQLALMQNGQDLPLWSAPAAPARTDCCSCQQDQRTLAAIAPGAWSFPCECGAQVPHIHCQACGGVIERPALMLATVHFVHVTRCIDAQATTQSWVRDYDLTERTAERDHNCHDCKRPIHKGERCAVWGFFVYCANCYDWMPEQDAIRRIVTAGNVVALDYAHLEQYGGAA